MSKGSNYDPDCSLTVNAIVYAIIKGLSNRRPQYCDYMGKKKNGKKNKGRAINYAL